MTNKLIIIAIISLLCNDINNVIYANILNMKAGPTSTFIVTDTACDYEQIFVEYTGNAEISDDYFWDFGDAVIISGSGQGPYFIKWNSGGLKKISLYVYSNPAYSDTTEHFVYIDKINSDISAYGNISLCQGDSITLYAAVNNNCNYQWFVDDFAIPGETSPKYTATQSGKYSVMFSSSITSCSVMSDSAVITINNNNFPLDFSANSQYMLSPPFAVAFNNLTPEAYKYNFKWTFGDGNDSICNNTPVFYLYDYSGLYDISLIAIDKISGCSDTITKPNYILCANGPVNPCNLSVNITSNINYPTCPGDTVILTANSQGASKYQWVLNGSVISNDTNQICYATGTGYYQVMVSDINCSLMSAPFTVSRYSVVIPQIFSEGLICPCSNDSMMLFTPQFANYTSVEWSNNDDQYSTFVYQSDFYTVSVTDVNSCTTISQPYAVNASLVQPPEICIALVDSSLGKNRIIWDDPPDIGLIDSFKIYKLNASGNFSLLSVVPNNIREIVDYSSIPLVHSDFYRISVVDTCNVESLPGNYHKTTHLNVSPAIPQGFALTWDHYQGFNFSKYYIYRGFSNSTLQLYDSIAYNPLVYTYTDTTSIQLPLYYMISAVKPGIPCIGSSSKDMSGPYSQSLSNVIDNIALIDTSIHVNIIINKINNEEIILFPNPAGNKINILYNNIDNAVLYAEIYDLLGNKVIAQFLNKNNNSINLHNLNNGLYLIKIKTNNGLYVKKFVKKE